MGGVSVPIANFSPSFGLITERKRTDMIEPENADSENRHNEQHERSLAEARALFVASDGSLGSVEMPSKKGFMALARKGADVWNAWRKTYPYVAPDFSGTSFRGNPVDFSGFDFPNTLNSAYCVDFSGSDFGDDNRFSKTAFGDHADFAGTTFFGKADFTQSHFGINADFTESTFNSTADFRWVDFGDGADFQIAKFNSTTHFDYCTFSGYCFFKSAIFARHANFIGTAFSRFATFYAAEFCFEISFVDAVFSETVDFTAATQSNAPAASRQFMYASFNGAVFHNRARFTGRQFLASTDFGIRRGNPVESEEPSPDKPTQFKGIPDFHGCEFHQDTSFDGAVFETPLNQEAARAFRTLKLAMEQLKATREEQRFFRLEMKAEHSSLPWTRRWLSWLYAKCSDYGFSLWRPIVWLLSLSLLFGAGYGLLANTCATNTDCANIARTANLASSNERTSALVKYTLASVAPVPGLDKMQTELRAPLFGHHGWVPIAALTLEILHKIAALVMVFLFALALRNLFKMKS